MAGWPSQCPAVAGVVVTGSIVLLAITFYTCPESLRLDLLGKSLRSDEQEEFEELHLYQQPRSRPTSFQHPVTLTWLLQR